MTEAVAFKESKIAELKQAEDAGVKSAGRMSGLFADYIKHLEANEAQAGDYAQSGQKTSERTTSYTVQPIEKGSATHPGSVQTENTREPHHPTRNDCSYVV